MNSDKILKFMPFAAAKASAEKLASDATEYRMNAGERAEYRTVGGENTLGVVLSGEITVRGLDGGQRMIYRTIGEGEIFGAARLFGGRDAYTVLTAKTSCEIVLIRESVLREAIASDGDFAVAFTETLCEKLRILNRKISALSASDAVSALAKYLLDAAKKNGTVYIKSRTELASRLGISRMTLYRALGEIERSGGAMTDGKTVTVKDEAALKSLL